MKLKAHQKSYQNWENGDKVVTSYFDSKGMRVIMSFATFWDATEKLVELSEGESSFNSKAAQDAIRSIL